MTNENKFKIGLCLQEIALSMDDATLERNRERLKLIEDIIAGEQEQKTGQWIDGHCSECDCEEPIFIVEMFGWRWIKDMRAKYCPNCGTRMNEVNE